VGQQSSSHPLNKHLSAAAERAKILQTEEVLVEEQATSESYLFLMLFGVARTLEDLHNPYYTLPYQPSSVVLYAGLLTWRWRRIWIHLVPIVVAILVLIETELLILRWEPCALRAREKPLHI